MNTRPDIHRCHAIDCEAPVPPKMLFCRPHWYMTPKALRDAVWAAYMPGQEVRKDPTRNWTQAARAAIVAVAEQEGRTVPKFYREATYWEASDE